MGRLMRWYNAKPIPRKRIEQFFEELYEASSIYMKEYADIEHWNTEVVKKKKFVPRGIIIHSSGMRTVKETLEVLNTGYYSSHFIVTSNKYTRGIPKKEFPLIHSLPSTIIMPFKLDDYIQHSGYLSPVTWSIEMRNLGQLRVSEEKFVGGMLPEEINYYNMRLWKKNALYYFWRKNEWTEPYEQPTYTWQGFHYENFTKAQYHTLCVLIKMLVLYQREIHPSLVLPASAIVDNPHNCPILPIDFIQKKISVIHGKDQFFELKKLRKFGESTLYNMNNVEGEDDTYIDDTRMIENRIKENKWRTTLDKEKLTKVFKHGDAKFQDIFHKYKKAIESMGYFVKEKYFTKSLHIYANARDIMNMNEDRLMFELERDFYSLVNGVYDE